MTNNTMDKAIAVIPKLHITHATEVRQFTSYLRRRDEAYAVITTPKREASPKKRLSAEGF